MTSQEQALVDVAEFLRALLAELLERPGILDTYRQALDK